MAGLVGVARPAAVARVVDESAIRAALNEEGGRARVIVMLRQPAPDANRADPSAANDAEGAENPDAKRRSNIELENKVLRRIGAKDFAISGRYENFPGFAGSITARGLDKLKADPDVLSIEPDRSVRAQPGGAIPAERNPDRNPDAEDGPGGAPVHNPDTGGSNKTEDAARFQNLEARVRSLEEELKGLKKIVRELQRKNSVDR